MSYCWLGLFIRDDYKLLGKHVLVAHSLYQTLLFGVSLDILIQSHTLNLYYICGHWELKSNFI